MGRKYIKSRHGLFGMVYYYDEYGNPLGKSRPGLMGGTRVYTDRNGRYAGKSRPGLFAKEVFTDPDYNRITSYDSFCGEMHFKNGRYAGHSRPGFFDSAYTAWETEEDGKTDVWEENFVEPNRQYHPKTSRSTAVKWLQRIFLGLVFCMFVACIYAVVRFC